MPWKKGESGNVHGRPDKAFADAVRLVVNEEDPVRRKRKLRCLAEELYVQAMKGEGWAMAQIADRLDGKPAQESTLTVKRQRALELSDSELDDIIARSRGGEEGPPNDPSQLN